MSEQHAQRIEKLRREFEAALEAATLTVQRYETLRPKSDISDLQHVANNAEITYYVRLCAEVERMLFRHLKDHFITTFNQSQLDELEKAGAFILLDYVRFKVKPNTTHVLPNTKVEAVKRVYSYRNRIAHGNRTHQAPVTISDAVIDLTKLVLELPSMK